MSKEKMYGTKVIRAGGLYMYVVVQACIIAVCIGVIACGIEISENNNGVKIEGVILNGEM